MSTPTRERRRRQLLQALVERLGPVDTGTGMINDFELHVDLPDARVAARVVYLRGTHASLLGD
jgi:hypothetical protein